MFKKNDVICTFGDSITAGGLWTAEVFQTLAPQGVKVYNCGVAGDTAYDSLRRIYSDCLCYSPNYVTVMFGINDIGRQLYPDRSNPDVENQIQFLYQRHTENMEKVIQILQSSGAEVILFTQPPYMEGEGFTGADLKCNCTIEKCVENVKNLAKKYNLKLVDINSAMKKASQTKKVIGDDRVHPTPVGNHIIAQEFLKSMGIIDEYDSNDEFTLSKENEERLEADSFYKMLMYGEHDIVGKYCDENNITPTREEMRNIALRKKDDPIKYIADCAKLYYDNAYRLYDAKNKMIELTIKMLAHNIK